MNTYLFILNIVSAVLLLNFLVANPSITGLVVAEPGTKIDLSNPLGISVLFIITVLAFDIYSYIKSRKE